MPEVSSNRPYRTIKCWAVVHLFKKHEQYINLIMEDKGNAWTPLNHKYLGKHWDGSHVYCVWGTYTSEGASPTCFLSALQDRVKPGTYHVRVTEYFTEEEK